MTNDERSAGIEARMNAARDDDRDFDIPSERVPHTCTEFSAVCVECVVTEQLAMAKVRAEIHEQNRLEWEAS